MKKNFARLVLLAAGAWSIRAVGPEASGLWALTTNLLAAVTIQAGLILSPWVLVVWALGVGLLWDVTTFSALGHHVLLIGGMGSLVCTQRGWWVGASAAEQMVGSILAAVTYFVADRVLHGLEVRQWSWPFTLSISLVLASFVNGLASVALGWCLETGARTAHVRMVGRGR